MNYDKYFQYNYIVKFADEKPITGTGYLQRDHFDYGFLKRYLSGKYSAFEDDIEITGFKEIEKSDFDKALGN